MALTLTELQKIKKADLDKFLAKHEAEWLAALKRAHAFLRDTLPAGTVIRPDDVYKALFPVVEADETLQRELSTNKLTQQYWFRYFCDYIIDTLWAKI